MAEPHGSVSLLVWVPADTAPARPREPYRLFLVWLHAEGGPISGGIPRVVQWDREAGCFCPGQLRDALFEDTLVVSHWAEIPVPAMEGADG